MREIQKCHDGRYKSVDAVYLCGEIGNPDKERLFIPFDKVLEIIDKYDIRRASAFKYAMRNDNYDNGFVAAITFVRADVLKLKGGNNG